MRELFESYDYSAMSGRYDKLLQGWNDWLMLVGLAGLKLRPATSNWLTELAMRCLQVLPGCWVVRGTTSAGGDVQPTSDAVSQA